MPWQVKGCGRCVRVSFGRMATEGLTRATRRPSPPPGDTVDEPGGLSREAAHGGRRSTREQRPRAVPRGTAGARAPGRAGSRGSGGPALDDDPRGAPLAARGPAVARRSRPRAHQPVPHRDVAHGTVVLAGRRVAPRQLLSRRRARAHGRRRAARRLRRGAAAAHHRALRGLPARLARRRRPRVAHRRPPRGRGRRRLRRGVPGSRTAHARRDLGGPGHAAHRSRRGREAPRAADRGPSARRARSGIVGGPVARGGGRRAAAAGSHAGLAGSRIPADERSPDVPHASVATPERPGAGGVARAPLGVGRAHPARPHERRPGAGGASPERCRPGLDRERHHLGALHRGARLADLLRRGQPRRARAARRPGGRVRTHGFPQPRQVSPRARGARQALPVQRARRRAPRRRTRGLRAADRRVGPGPRPRRLLPHQRRPVRFRARAAIPGVTARAAAARLAVASRNAVCRDPRGDRRRARGPDRGVHAVARHGAVGGRRARGDLAGAGLGRRARRGQPDRGCDLPAASAREARLRAAARRGAPHPRRRPDAADVARGRLGDARPSRGALPREPRHERALRRARRSAPRPFRADGRRRRGAERRRGRDRHLGRPLLRDRGAAVPPVRAPAQLRRGRGPVDGVGTEARRAHRAQPLPAGRERDLHRCGGGRRRLPRGRGVRGHAGHRHGPAARHGPQARVHDRAPLEPRSARRAGARGHPRLRPRPAARRDDAGIRARRHRSRRSTAALPASTRTPARSPTPTRTCSARGRSPAKASTRSTSSTPCWKAASPTRPSSPTTCWRAASCERRSRPTSRSSTPIRPTTAPSAPACTAGRAATGRPRRGSPPSCAARTRRATGTRSMCSTGGRSSRTCAAACCPCRSSCTGSPAGS